MLSECFLHGVLHMLGMLLLLLLLLHMFGMISDVFLHLFSVNRVCFVNGLRVCFRMISDCFLHEFCMISDCFLYVFRHASRQRFG